MSYPEPADEDCLLIAIDGNDVGFLILFMCGWLFKTIVMIINIHELWQNANLNATAFFSLIKLNIIQICSWEYS